MDIPETRYARSGEYHIAYQALGEGPPDIVNLATWFTNVEAAWEFAPLAAFQLRFVSLGRLIQFDKRGTGLSDPVPLRTLPTLEEWIDDLRTVLDAVGVERTAIVASGETGAMALLFAATNPERVSALVLFDSWARMAQAPDYPFGLPEELVDPAVEFIEKTWGTGPSWDWIAPDADDPEMRQAYARYERQAASPGTAAQMRRMHYDIDVRHVLPLIAAPTLVIHHSDNRWARVEHSRFLAAHITGASFVELPGPWFPWNEQLRDQFFDEVAEFLTGMRPLPRVDRVLSTVLFTDVVDSTRLVAERGDRAWRNLLERHRELVRRQLERHRGREVSTTGDGFLATFDGPARAIQCASAIIQGSRSLGIEVRAGLHTGEIELMGSDVGGIAVHVGARVAALAGSGEVFVSSTVKDLVAGSGIEFDDRGICDLKGVPGEWRLYAVKA